MDIRIGHGYDAHKLKEGRLLIIGGVEIPYERGLDGHSDADVLTHAIMDALLGAVAMGDIGGMFPDSDVRYKNARSMELLSQVCDRLKSLSWNIGNIDATIVAQNPKLSPFIMSMRKEIAVSCQIPIDAVNVKATTEENMGFTGKGDGICAHAVCLVEKIDAVP